MLLVGSLALGRFSAAPTVRYNDRKQEIREATEYEGYEIDTPDGPLTEDECKRAGIPGDQGRAGQ
jgi:hypothetical protein